jgi:hypothetical protein
MSLFHFHRIYLGAFDETPADTVRRLRLERAMQHLLESDSPLSEIGIRAGYASAPAFNRAFKRFSGVAPGVFRQARKAAAQGLSGEHVFSGLQATIRTEEALTLALVPYAGVLNDLLTDLAGKEGEETLLLLPPAHDRDDESERGLLRIGRPVKCDGNVAPLVTIEGGKVACLRFQDSRRSALPVFAAMLGGRDAKSRDHSIDGRTPFEFLARLAPAPSITGAADQWRMEIVLPLGPRSIIAASAPDVLE